MTSIYSPLRRELTEALGEAQTENPWIEAQIALELVKARLSLALTGTQVQNAEGAVMDGPGFIEHLFKTATC